MLMAMAHQNMPRNEDDILRAQPAGTISMAVTSRTPTVQTEKMTTTASRVAKRYCHMAVFTPCALAMTGLSATSSMELKPTACTRKTTGTRASRKVSSSGPIVRISPKRNCCMLRAVPCERLTTARPKATTAEKTTPMAMSDEMLLLLCRATMPSPTRMPKASMVHLGSQASSRPNATPAKAECPMASEKKAMRKCITSTPRTALTGASSSSPKRACCIKPC